VEIEFDPVKDATNIAKRGLSLRLAAVLLSGLHDVETDDRFDYGEQREIATGRIGDRLFVCVYTKRGNVYRIISLRKANRREVNAYRQSHQG
jgi:uncharacterized DUF497 family protein